MYYYSIHFGGFEDGLIFQLGDVRNARREQVQNLLLDLDRVLRSMDGMQSVEWFPESVFDSGCRIMNYESLGAPTPIPPIPVVE